MKVIILLFCVTLSCVLPEELPCGNYNGSCFEISKGKLSCCAYLNAVLCPNRKSCCPQGSVCSFDSHGTQCTYPYGEVFQGKPVGPCSLDSTEKTGSTKIQKANGLAPIICPDRLSSCPEETTCCPMATGKWGCCGQKDAVCCKDGLHCCARGTECNAQKGTCDPSPKRPFNPLDFFTLDEFLWPELASARRLPEQPQKAHLNPPLMAYDGVMCEDNLHECPLETTCCRDQDDNFACCPFPKAVCCADKIHCCPHDTKCDEHKGLCEKVSIPQLTTSKPKPMSKDTVQLCPDGYSRCLDSQTCCQLPNQTWGCCPVPEAVCCSDQYHCCPNGYRCDVQKKSCLKPPSANPTMNMITCPNAEYQCDNGTTCCPLPNGEWACCPFDDAVCCSDQAHCCPSNTVCDIEHSKCTTNGQVVDFSRKKVPALRKSTSENVCSSGLVQCPGGTCCTNSVGLDSCCPYPDAVCCADGAHCCPNGNQCDASTGNCITPKEHPVAQSIPWLSKVPAQHTTQKVAPKEAPISVNSKDRICPDKVSSCDGDRSCCPLTDGTFACCPLDNGTCCNDGFHCCPSGSVCAKGNTCERRLTNGVQKKVSKAHKMTSVASERVGMTKFMTMHGVIVRSTLCGACPNDQFCCPNAAGLANSKCCPVAAGVCCSDGEHCCPRDTHCVGNGQCESDDSNAETYFAPRLIGAKQAIDKTLLFIPQAQPSHLVDHVFAVASMQARIDPLFLVDRHYRLHNREYTVCPDRERTCSLDQQCCLSSKAGYVCIPKQAVCCSADTDSYCPIGHTCSVDGITCL